MEHHGDALERLTRERSTDVDQRTARTVRGRRPLWLTTGGLTAAAAVAVGFALVGQSSPAYAVTQNPDGTVTVSLTAPSGISGANAQLKVDGDPVVVVPVRAGCPGIGSLPHPSVQPFETRSSAGRNGTVTITAKGLPAGVTVLVAAQQGADHAMQMSIGLVAGQPPTCVSLPPIP